ncbi:hypothetical protein BH23VER1_BH23VER1_04800 [soil metagenome]
MTIRIIAFATAIGTLQGTWASGADHAQFGQAWNRNMVSGETGLPAGFDPGSGENVKWTVELGSETHSTPVVADGRVLVGTNNANPRDPKHVGDRGVLMCFDEADGTFLWQSVVPKRTEDRFFDWPLSGMSSTATVHDGQVFIVNNRGDVMCLDLDGMADGNDGPFRDEGRYMVPDGEAPLEAGPTDADIVWLCNLTDEAGIWSHDAAHSSILVDGDFLYLNTGTGVDNTHKVIRRPDAPSLVVLDRKTGRFLAREREGIGPDIFHCTWSAPALAEVGGRRLVFLCAGNGVIYAFAPLEEPPPEGEVATLERVWSTDVDPGAPKSEIHRFHGNRLRGPTNFFGMPVVVGETLYAAGGGDLWWGKNEAWLFALDAGTGSERWRYALNRHVMATPAVADGLAFITDTGRTVHCVDARTGDGLWTHDVEGEVWGSALVADGKVYVVTRKGHALTFAATREKTILAEHDFRDAASATPVAAGGTLYLATMRRLFALEQAPAERDEP